MQVELSCPHCQERFTISPNSPAAEIIERIVQEGPFSAVGDGETLEDRISAALEDHAPLCCPECGEIVQWSEENLGRLTKDLLAEW